MKISNPKSTVVSVLVLGILALSFFGIFSFKPSQANALVVNNPNATKVTDNFCIACGASQNEFGTIQTPQLVPSQVQGRGLLNEIYCNAATPTPVEVTSITDTLGNTWTKVQTLHQSGGSFVGKEFMSSVWITNMVNNSAASIVITINFAPNAFDCQFNLFLFTTGILQSPQVLGSFQFQKVGTGIFQSNLNMVMSTSGNINAQAGAIVWDNTWINTTVTDTAGTVQMNNLGLLSFNNVGLGDYLFFRNYFGYYPNNVSQTFSTHWTSTNSAGGQNYGIGNMVMVFYSTVAQPQGCNPNCQITGGGTQISASVFSLTANTTYYYTANSGIGGLTITNITSKIFSYVNNVAGKSNNTLQITVYLSSCSSNGVPIFSLTCPYTNFGTFAEDFYIPNSTSKQFIHIPSTSKITIPANVTYVVAMIDKFSGLSIYQALNAQPMYSTNEGTFSGANWKPPNTITIQNPTTPQLFLEWFGYSNQGVKVFTSTSSTIVTCSSGSSCITGTATTQLTQTTVLYSRSSGATPTNDLQDLETYFPIWIFPLIFSPFGIQGVLVGALIGTVLGALLGIVPLWAGFLLSIGLLYVMYKRG